LATTAFVAQSNAGFFQLSSVEFGQIHCLIVVVEGENISILLGIVRCLVFFAFSVLVCGLAMSPLGPTQKSLRFYAERSGRTQQSRSIAD
jgi:hypothetical protein